MPRQDTTESKRKGNAHDVDMTASAMFYVLTVIGPRRGPEATQIVERAKRATSSITVVLGSRATDGQSAT